MWFIQRNCISLLDSPRIQCVMWVHFVVIIIVHAGILQMHLQFHEEHHHSTSFGVICRVMNRFNSSAACNSLFYVISQKRNIIESSGWIKRKRNVHKKNMWKDFSSLLLQNVVLRTGVNTQVKYSDDKYFKLTTPCSHLLFCGILLKYVVSMQSSISFYIHNFSHEN